MPLQNVKVLDLTRLIPGALCSRMLGDLGAEVIKIEETGIGDYERQIPPFIGEMASRFLILNRNKKSVALNLKAEEGRKIFLEMVKTSDVVVEGFRPGVMRKLGLDYPTLRNSAPAIIFCSISSFGQNGPYRDLVAHDINILGEAGYFDASGKVGETPAIPGIQLADSVSGTYAALGIVVALMHREKTGKGQYIDVSMFDGIISWMFDSARYLFSGETVPPGGEGRLTGGLSNYNLYETKDGKYMAVGAIETKFKNQLLEKLGKSDWIEQETQKTSFSISGKDKKLHALFRDIFKTKTRDEWCHELKELNICVTPVRSVEEAFNHPQTVYREMVLNADHPAAGPHKQIGFPIKFSDISPDSTSQPAPVLGEHTVEIMKALGYNEKRINRLAEEGVIEIGRKSMSKKQ